MPAQNNAHSDYMEPMLRFLTSDPDSPEALASIVEASAVATTEEEYKQLEQASLGFPGLARRIRKALHMH